MGKQVIDFRCWAARKETYLPRCSLTQVVKFYPLEKEARLRKPPGRALSAHSGGGYEYPCIHARVSEREKTDKFASYYDATEISLLECNIYLGWRIAVCAELTPIWQSISQLSQSLVKYLKQLSLCCHTDFAGSAMASSQNMPGLLTIQILVSIDANR